MSEIESNSEGGEHSSEESSESEGGSGSGSSSYESTGSDSGSRLSETEPESEEEEIEPVLKYRRFARDVVASISQVQGGHESNVICCMAVHSKVSFAVQYKLNLDLGGN